MVSSPPLPLLQPWAPTDTQQATLHPGLYLSMGRKGTTGSKLSALCLLWMSCFRTLLSFLAHFLFLYHAKYGYRPQDPSQMTQKSAYRTFHCKILTWLLRDDFTDLNHGRSLNGKWRFRPVASSLPFTLVQEHNSFLSKWSYSYINVLFFLSESSCVTTKAR